MGRPSKTLATGEEVFTREDSTINASPSCSGGRGGRDGPGPHKEDGQPTFDNCNQVSQEIKIFCLKRLKSAKWNAAIGEE